MGAGSGDASQVHQLILLRDFYINLVLAAVTALIYIFWFPRHGAHRHENDPATNQKPGTGLAHYSMPQRSPSSLPLARIVVLSGPWDSGSVISLWAMTGVSAILYVL